MKERGPLEFLSAKLRGVLLRQMLDEELISEYTTLKKSGKSDEKKLRLLEHQADTRGMHFEYDDRRKEYYLVLDYEYMSLEHLEESYAYCLNEDIGEEEKAKEISLLEQEAKRRNMSFRFRGGVWKLE